ncbi:G patch domain-containing protein 11 [Monomorium pharaonis]|uniref:G patch domain-containing protein 11 n=1 Tax=Monomorium pharaonis TaxID=307658 RepID=UPI00063EDAC2|nr:G patch domain-containing protein 11 [Monomorium pharaonis]XP_012521550.1 G patch domain-containing protein 11 [Monomorium pharaonis]XP_036149423.1 G patch domain-containing protein 11 [Monomorium pharaonis]
MSDDEDYMSDKFLHPEQRVSSSLIYRHSDKREFTLMKKKTEIESRMREQSKSIRTVEVEKREQGLSSAITSANKGFEMLMKMGYKPGQGIGKTQSGMTEPIPVEVKVDRQGLGKTLKKKDSHKCENINAKLDNMATRNFRSRIAQEKTEQLQKIDLHKSQKVCQELDTKDDIEKPQESWFWPETKEEKEADDSNDDIEDDETFNDLEKLDILTRYLRKKYFYCIWCGTKFNDEDDLRDNCPGSTRNDH